MRLTVVRKIIIGFVVFACLLLVTNVLSYFGLSDIRDSAKTVVEQKMPVQAKMLNVKIDMLTLAKISTQAYFQEDQSLLSSNRKSFDELAVQLEVQLAELSTLLSGRNTSLQEGLNKAQLYLDNTRKMYGARSSILDSTTNIDKSTNAMLAQLDEASALLLDLSYMENDAASFDRLVGTGTNIDNKITPVMRSVKELAKSTDGELVTTIADDINFTLSNIEADIQYLNRLAQDVNTDGVIEQFNKQYANAKLTFTNELGLLALVQNKLSLIQQSVNFQQKADAALDHALTVFTTLFNQVNEDVLYGQNDILDNVQKNIIKGVVVMLVAMVLVFVVGILATRSIALPLIGINSRLEKLSKGDLTVRATIVGNDEFTTLSKSVNELSNSLHNVIEGIHQQELELQSATNLSVEMGELTLKQVELQRQQVQLTSDNTDQVRATSQSNVKQINYAMGQLEKVAEQSVGIEDLVEESKLQILSQAEQSHSSSEVIKRLDVNSRNIGSILDVIKNIAEQTNLLALNAAIEAARAGEQGRGFAVVADEVRNLANKTQKSTTEIESVISSLQTDANLAVVSIEAGTLQSQKSVELIGQVSSETSVITQVIEELKGINKKIVDDSNEQDELLKTVAESLSNIVELTEKSAQSTLDSNAATQKIDELSERLNQMVSSFKLS